MRCLVFVSSTWKWFFPLSVAVIITNLHMILLKTSSKPIIHRLYCTIQGVSKKRCKQNSEGHVASSLRSHLYQPLNDPITISPVRYAKLESIRYFIDIDILQNCLIDIDIFQNHHIDIDIFNFSISISISIFLELPYRYRYFSELPYRYRYFQLLHIDIDIFQKCRYIDNRYFISIF